MAIIGKGEPSNCPKCGLTWLGTTKCECGWRPNAAQFVLKSVLTSALVALAIGACWLAPHYHEYFPDKASAQDHLNRGKDFAHRGEAREAINELKEAAALDPKDAQIHRETATVLFADGSAHEASSEMLLAHQLDPQNTEISKEYCVLLSQTGYFKEAIKLFVQLHGELPTDINEKRKLAELYGSADDYAHAERLYLEIAKARPREGNVLWLSLASLQEKRNDRKASIATLRTGLSYLPGDALLQETLAITLMEDKQNADAIKAFTRATDLEPSLAQRNSEYINNLRNGGGKEHAYVIPLTRIGNGFHAKVRINDSVEGDFLVDTGASTVAISTDVAKRLNITNLTGSPMLVSGATGVALSRHVVLNSVQVGGAKEMLVDAAILPHAGGIDGLLGMSFLHRYQFSIDFKKNVLVLKQR